MIGFWPPCFLPTSSAQPNSLNASAIGRGGNFSTVTTLSSGRNWRVSRGREIDTAGDGFFATFDGPARGVRCALAIRDVVRSLGIEIRAGLHTGECELMGDKVGGIAVHIGARVMACSEAGSVLVSRTVKDLVAGSGLEFTGHGIHQLKGLTEEWELFFAT